jgi:hypothetical protein
MELVGYMDQLFIHRLLVISYSGLQNSDATEKKFQRKFTNFINLLQKQSCSTYMFTHQSTTLPKKNSYAKTKAKTCFDWVFIAGTPHFPYMLDKQELYCDLTRYAPLKPLLSFIQTQLISCSHIMWSCSEYRLCLAYNKLLPFNPFYVTL